jgi:acetoin utilization deacetylase AcuC-like enzyme
MGFCIFANVAIAARYAQLELGLERVAVVDFDVHHGNGTEALFAHDPSVLTVSLHQWPFWPGTGAASSTDGIVNIPLPAGSGDDVYRSAFDEWSSRLFELRSELVIVAAGFDAHRDDPLAEMEMSAEGFHDLARRSAGLRRGSPPCSKAATTSTRCRIWSPPLSRDSRALPRRRARTRDARAPRAETTPRASSAGS